MEVFYHGTSVLFEKFDLTHAFEGDGKCKFGYGVYATQIYTTAAHYSGCGRGKLSANHYVYTIEVPEMKDDNHIWSNKIVNAKIVSRTEERFGEKIPIEVIKKGMSFRKYIGNKVLHRKGTIKQLSSKTDLEGEMAASKFLLSIGVEMLIWPYNQTDPNGKQNRAILDDSKVKIIKIEEIELDNKGQLIPDTNKEVKMGKLSIREIIETYYPEYYSWNKYPINDCVPIRGTKDKWGVLGNFYSTPIQVNGKIFQNTEQLFQMMKFIEKEPLIDIYTSKGMTVKMKAKKWQNLGKSRSDWGRMIVDVMKFCLMTKYDQCKEFREELERSKGKYIVEDESDRKNTTWGTKIVEDHYVGSNLLGRLLMELRDKGKLEYQLPPNALDFINVLENNAKK